MRVLKIFLFTLFTSLMSNSLLSQQQDSTKWNFGVTVKLGYSNIYPVQDDYRLDYPGVFPFERIYGIYVGGYPTPSLSGYYSYEERKKKSYQVGFSAQYSLSKYTAIELGICFNSKNYFYPVYFSTTDNNNSKRFDRYYLDLPISYQYSFLIRKKSKLRISAGFRGCIFLYGDRNNEFFLDMYEKAVVIHRGNYSPIAMMLNGSIQYVFPLFKNHIAVGPTFQFTPMSFTKKENAISSPHRYNGETYEVSENYEFKPYFIGAGLTYYLR